MATVLVSGFTKMDQCILTSTLISPSGLTIFYQLSYRWHYLPTVWLIAESLEAFPVLKQCIDFDTRMQLSELMFKNDGDNKWSCWTSLGSLAERKSSSVAADTLRFLGQQ